MEFNFDLNGPPPVDNNEPDGLEDSDNDDLLNSLSQSNGAEHANRARALSIVISVGVTQIVSPVEQNLQPRGAQPAIHRVPVALVEQNLQPQPEPIDVVVVDSTDDEEEDEDHRDENYNLLSDDDEVIIISSTPAIGQASSSRTTHGRTPLNDSNSAQIADNHQRRKRTRTDLQPPVINRDNNAPLVGTRSSMQELVVLPPTQASTSVFPTCMGATGASCSKPNPVAPVAPAAPVAPVAPPPPPPPPPPPTFNCPICMGPFVDAVIPLCGHMFCKDCLKAAIAVQPKCPLCRFRVNHRELRPIYFPSD